MSDLIQTNIERRNASGDLSARNLYARLWRWHFFAALLVIPFVLWQSVTGTLYVWHREYERTMHPDLLFVQPGAQRASYQAQLETALAHQPGAKFSHVVVNDDPDRSTEFYFTAENGLSYPVFVNPYSGGYIGDVAPARWLAGITRSLHGGWPWEPYGSYILELGDGWTIVMILTGLYLWWPRGNGMAGAVYPRLHSGSRIFWRDIHAVVAVYFSAVVLTFLITAMPWTTFWGNNVLKPVERVLHQRSPSEEFFRGGNAKSQHHGGEAGVMTTLDTLVAQARTQGARGEIELRMRAGQSVVNVRDHHDHAADEIYLKLDAQTGAVISKATWQEFSPIPKFVATGVELHEGTLFGRANQIMNSLMSLALIWLSISGFIGWYKRRPQKASLSAPPKRSLRWTNALKFSAVGLCVVFPLFGASVLLISGVDRVFGKRMPT